MSDSRKEVSALDIMEFSNGQADLAQIVMPELKKVPHRMIAVAIATAIDTAISQGACGIQKHDVFKPKKPTI